jgi:hypothetical protein
MSLLSGVGRFRLVVTLQYIYVYMLPASVCAKIEGDYKSTHKTYINNLLYLFHCCSPIQVYFVNILTNVHIRFG